MYKNKIKQWDEIFCAQHVHSLAMTISNIFIEKNINKISYLDIGANVGKVYDLLSDSLIVERSWMIEASPILFEYLSEKFVKNKSIETFNLAISDIEGEVNFDESSIIYQIDNNIDNLNFGLSKVTNFGFSNKVISKKISVFLSENPEIYKFVNFIKIDTENMDFIILDDLCKCIETFENKPIIEFEINYFVNGYTDDWAQNILDRFSMLGYNELEIKNLRGDGILIPKK